MTRNVLLALGVLFAFMAAVHTAGSEGVQRVEAEPCNWAFLAG